MASTRGTHSEAKLHQNRYIIPDSWAQRSDSDTENHEHQAKVCCALSSANLPKAGFLTFSQCRSAEPLAQECLNLAQWHFRRGVTAPNVSLHCLSTMLVGHGDDNCRAGSSHLTFEYFDSVHDLEQNIHFAVGVFFIQ